MLHGVGVQVPPGAPFFLLNKLRLFAGDTKMLIELITLGPLIAIMILIVLMAYGYMILAVLLFN